MNMTSVYEHQRARLLEPVRGTRETSGKKRVYLDSARQQSIQWASALRDCVARP